MQPIGRLHRALSMSTSSHLDCVWDVVEKVGVCMMTTRFSDGLQPLLAIPFQASP